MDRAQFKSMLHHMQQSELHLNNTKGVEYAGEDNPFGNLDYVAEAFGVSPLLVCGIYLEKHLASIRHWVKATLGGTRIIDGALTEPIESRFDDARLYMALMRGLVERERDREGKDKRTLKDYPLSAVPDAEDGAPNHLMTPEIAKLVRDGCPSKYDQHIASSMGCSPSPRATQMEGGVIRPDAPTPRVGLRVGERTYSSGNAQQEIEVSSFSLRDGQYREDLSTSKAPSA